MGQIYENCRKAIKYLKDMGQIYENCRKAIKYLKDMGQIYENCRKAIKYLKEQNKRDSKVVQAIQPSVFFTNNPINTHHKRL